MAKSKKVYILYSYNEFEKDFNYIMEYNNLEELKKQNNIELKNKKSIYHYIKEDLNEINHLLKDRFIIIKENLHENY